MKKLFILAAAACVTLASCVKNEPVQTSGLGEAISFEDPIVSLNTKAGVAEVPASFLANRDFAVWAHHTTAEWDASNIAKTVWMNKVTITKIGEQWKNATSYYWPKEGYLHFSAYSPASVSASIDATGITFENYVVGQQAAQVDLLVSDRVTAKKSGVVPVVFNHILSAVNFIVKTTALNGPDFTLTGITVTGIKSKGTFNQGLTTAQNSQLAVAEENDDRWSGQDVATSYPLTITQFEIDNTGKYAHNGAAETSNEASLILLPQSLENAKVVVNYTMEGVAQESTFNITGKWLRGYRYNYTIGFGADEITFTPTADTWGDPQTGTIAPAQ